jgi:KaiC/GvpD/RAD55 family RecA-like ATPase
MLTVSKQPFSLVRQVLQAAPAALEAEQQAVVAHRGSPIVVQGGPGTGKTTVLVEAALARIADGQNPDAHLNSVAKMSASR